MKRSPVYPKYETDDYDAHADFDQFLKEAKRYSSEAKLHQEEDGSETNKRQNQEKKKKWMKILTPWWKQSWLSEANKSHVDVGEQIRRKGYVCGELAAEVKHHHRRTTSGPLINLTSLFNPTTTKSAAADQQGHIPYMCLNQLATPRATSQSYGPVYMV